MSVKQSNSVKLIWMQEIQRLPLDKTLFPDSNGGTRNWHSSSQAYNSFQDSILDCPPYHSLLLLFYPILEVGTFFLRDPHPRHLRRRDHQNGQGSVKQE